MKYYRKIESGVDYGTDIFQSWPAYFNGEVVNYVGEVEDGKSVKVLFVDGPLGATLDDIATSFDVDLFDNNILVQYCKDWIEDFKNNSGEEWSDEDIEDFVFYVVDYPSDEDVARDTTLMIDCKDWRITRLPI